MFYSLSLLCLLFCTMLGNVASSYNLTVTVFLNLTAVVHRVDERYLSNTLSPVNLERKHFNLSSAKIRTLARQLAPAYGRFGGTPADFIIFSPQINSAYDRNGALQGYETCTDITCNWVPTSNYTLTGANLDSLWHFAKDTGWRLLFDLNVFVRNGSNWDPENAKKLLRYIIERNYSTNMDFELGNEPNAYKHALNKSISPEQLAKDFQILSNILREDPEFKPYFIDSNLVGPDVTQPFHDRPKDLDYLKKFLKSTKLNTLHAVTWHHYYENKRYASSKNFTDPATLDLFPRRAMEVKGAIVKAGFGSKKVWIGETGSISGRSIEGYTDAYANGFLWLDKLGQAAKLGLEVVMQSTFLDGDRCLVEIDPPYNPLPSYWLSLLYKILVGPNVFATSTTDTTGKLRAYTHCVNSQRSKYKAGTVVLFLINLHHSMVSIGLNPPMKNVVIDQYLLLPEGNEITSKNVFLNGHLLKMIDDHTIPPLLSMRITTNKIVLPRLSYGFFVVRDLQSRLCY